MRIHVLGSAAGGGFPQWNCNCAQCHGLRNKTIRTKARSQSSLAVSTDNRNWVLFNTSPDIRSQLESFADIQPQSGLRDTGIAAIVYMDSQIDHTTGLLMLREGCPHEIYCTDMVFEDLTTGFPVFKMLESWNGGINRHTIEIDDNGKQAKPFGIPDIDDLIFTPVPLSSKAPPYSPHRHDPHPGDNIGIFIEDRVTEKSVFYAPGVGEVDEYLMSWFSKADCLLVDGTFWTEDEMLRAGVGDKMASSMGHLPQSTDPESGKEGMIDILDRLDTPRKILIHINNTNPILNEESPQRQILEQHSIEVAYDGMEVIL